MIKVKTEISEIEQLREKLQRYDLYGIPSIPAELEHPTIKSTEVGNLENGFKE